MNKAELYELVLEIKANYSNFDVSEAEIERHFRHLKDFPFITAMKNIDTYVKTNQYPPKIADIRGKLGEQMDGEISKRQAAENEAYLTHWLLKESEPPKGYWQSIREKLRGEQHA